MKQSFIFSKLSSDYCKLQKKGEKQFKIRLKQTVHSNYEIKLCFNLNLQFRLLFIMYSENFQGTLEEGENMP